MKLTLNNRMYLIDPNPTNKNQNNVAVAATLVDHENKVVVPLRVLVLNHSSNVVYLQQDGEMGNYR